MKDVREEIEDLTYEIEGSLDYAITVLQKRRDRYSDSYHDLEIESRLDGDFYTERLRLVLVGRRPETEKEKEARLRLDRKKKEEKEEREKRMLEELKAKYE